MRAWRQDDELQHAAWLRVLHGRRPPSEKWPRANNQQRQRQSGNVQRPQKPQVQDVQRLRRTPEETQAMVATKVRRIEAATAALGDDDGEELATLQSCPRRARLQAQVPAVDKRIADCSQFIERAKKRA